jgi:magnesium transporter
MTSATIIRVLDIDARGEVKVSSDLELVRPPPGGILRWIDVQDQDAETLRVLRERFDFHPLAIEDCMHFDQRAKVEEYTETLFVVTHGVETTADGEVEIRELHAFLGKQYLVTVHATPMRSVEATWQRIAGDGPLARRGTDYLYYLVADATVDEFFPVLDAIGDRVEALETSVLEDPTVDDLAEIFVLRRMLTTIRKSLTPQRDAFALLSKRGGAHVTDRTSVYFRDVFDHVARISESIDNHRDMLGNSLDAYLSAVSNRTNATMKSLTIMSSIFLPLSFVVGFFGQNFDNFPMFLDWIHSDTLMWMMMGLCVAIPVTLMIAFKRSGWW